MSFPLIVCVRVWCLYSFTEVPCVQRQALWQRVTASPWLSADDQDTGHSVHRWQVNSTLTHTLSLSLPLPHIPHTNILSHSLAGKQWRKGGKKLLVLLDLWLLGLHLMYMASIDPGKASIMPAWRSVRDFLASLHVFSVFMGTGINLTASTDIVAGNHLDIYSIKVPPPEPL